MLGTDFHFKIPGFGFGNTIFNMTYLILDVENAIFIVKYLSLDDYYTVVVAFCSLPSFCGGAVMALVAVLMDGSQYWMASKWPIAPKTFGHRLRVTLSLTASNSTRELMNC